MSRAHGKRPSSRWIGALFALGSACFAVAAIASQWASASRPAIGVTFFAGSIFFTTAAFLQFAQAAGLATAVQLAGTILFNISTFEGMKRGLDARQSDLRVWTPDAFGSICFLVASELAFAETCHRWVCLRVRSRPWRIAALNLVGSIAFGVAAVASIVQPSDDEPVSAAICNAGTAFGAICFLAGGLLLIAEARSHDHRSQRSPDHDGPSARSAPADAV
jgi:YrhK-like protein